MIPDCVLQCITRKEGEDMAISLRLSEEDTILIKNYAAIHNISVSDLIRQSVMEKIEDEYDLEAFEKAMEDYRKDPVTYSLEEVGKELDLI